MATFLRVLALIGAFILLVFGVASLFSGGGLGSGLMLAGAALGTAYGFRLIERVTGLKTTPVSARFAQLGIMMSFGLVGLVWAAFASNATDTKALEAAAERQVLVQQQRAEEDKRLLPEQTARLTQALAEEDWLAADGAGKILVQRFPGSEGALLYQSREAEIAPAAGELRVRAQIAEHVFEPYTATDYPDTMRLAGRGGAQRIQSIREGAARRALEGDCDFVELAEVSTSGSTRENLEVFVDCRNRNRFVFNEQNLAAAPVRTQASMAIDRATAHQICADHIRATVNNPSTLDIHSIMGSAFAVAETTGIAQLRLDFDASNAFGVESNFTAMCTFSPGSSTPDFQVGERRR